MVQYLCVFLRSTLILHYFFTLVQAFAWWPDLLAEHAEKFWALFTVDMDTALEAQPQDSWDSFPLFQLLNNFLRNDSKHVHFLSYRKWGGGWGGHWREGSVSERVFTEVSHSLNKIDTDNINACSVLLTFSSWVLGKTSSTARLLHWLLKFLLFLPSCLQELLT